MNDRTKLNHIDLFFSGENYSPLNFVVYFDQFLESDRLITTYTELLNIYSVLKSKLERDQNNMFLVPIEDDLNLNVSKVNEDFDVGEVEICQHFKEASNKTGDRLVESTYIQMKSKSALAISFSHAVGDATSLFQFIHNWALLMQGKEIELPEFDRDVFNKIVLGSRMKLRSMAKLLKESIVYRQKNREEAKLNSFIGVEQETYSRDFLGEERKKAKEKGEAISSVNVIVADLLKKKSSLMEEGSVGLVIPYDLRILNPDFPNNYFGNAFKGARTSYDVVYLNNSSLVEIAIEVKNFLKNVNYEEFVEEIQMLEVARKSKGVEFFQNSARGGGQNIVISDLSKVPLSFLNFGKGPCTAFGPLSYGYRSTVAIIKTENGYVTHRGKFSD